MEINDNGNQLQVVHSGRTFNKQKRYITRIERFKNSHVIHIYADDTPGNREYLWQSINSRVVITPDADTTKDLLAKIKGMIKNFVVFVATEGQKVFSVEGYFDLNDNCTVRLNRVETMEGFTVIDNVVKFTDGLAEGTEVIVEKL